MDAPSEELASLAALLPDVPRFLETRGMLLGGYAEVTGFEEGGEALPSFVARDAEEGLVCVVGTPEAAAISDAVARNGDRGALISMPENVSRVRQALPGWEAQPAALHRLAGYGRLPETPEGEVRLLSRHEDLTRLPPGFRAELRAELGRALRRGAAVAATFVEGVPVSLCYAAAETEGLWDVSIDTLEGHRRRGHAARCAAYMVRHMRDTTGKEPVWGALLSNAASMGLAERLGFVIVDRFFVFEPAERGG